MENKEIDQESWDIGFQDGLHPTEQVIVGGCPEELDEYSWLDGFRKGQAERKKKGLLD